MDREKEENRKGLLGDYQENEENQNAPAPDELQGQKARKGEDPGQGGRPGERAQELHAAQLPPEAQKVHKTYIQNTGDKGCARNQPSPPKKGQERAGCPKPRDQKTRTTPHTEQGQSKKG